MDSISLKGLVAGEMDKELFLEKFRQIQSPAHVRLSVVLELWLVHGKSDEEIAQEIDRTIDTVERIIADICKFFGINDRIANRQNRIANRQNLYIWFLKFCPKDFALNRNLYLDNIDVEESDRHLPNELDIPTASEDISQPPPNEPDIPIACEDIQKLTTIDVIENLKKYAIRLENLYGFLQLEFMSALSVRHRIRIPILKIFTPQTLRESPPLLDISKDLALVLKASGQIDRDFWQGSEDYYERPTRSVLDFLKDPECSHAVITGNPGSGKSILVHYIAMIWAEDWPNNILLIPLIIELRKYIHDYNQSNGDFLEYLYNSKSSICKGIFDKQQLQGHLTDGRAFVIFDGLDEVWDPLLRVTTTEQIINFKIDFPKIKILVTSRKIGYLGERFHNAGFREFTIEDLNDEQIAEFSARWHKLVFVDKPDKCEEYRAKLDQSIAASLPIRRLARNPLMLTMIASLNGNQELPRKRYELYEAASKLLLSNWDVKHQLEDENLPDIIFLEQKRKILQNLAYYMQFEAVRLITNGRLVEIFTKYLAQYLQQNIIDPIHSLPLTKRIINNLRERNLIICLHGGGTYGFVHDTFLEFFCAAEFVYQLENGQITIEHICKEVLEVHWQNSRWHEVFLFLAGRLERTAVEKMIRYLMDMPIDFQTHRNVFQKLKKSGIENLLLAAKLLNEVQDRSAIADTDSKLLEALKALTEQNLDIISNLALNEIFEKVWKDNSALNDWLNSIPELIDFDEPDDLRSDKGADYQILRDLLRSREWEAADIETNRIMIEVGGKAAEGHLKQSDIEVFPCTDLETINRLWTKYSARKLGFSAQKQVWLSVPDAKDYEKFLLFAECVGWLYKGEMGSKSKVLEHKEIYQLKYRLKNKGMHVLVYSPLGKSKYTIRGFLFGMFFFSRAETCGI